MFGGNFLEDMQAAQEALEKQMNELEVTHRSPGGGIELSINGQSQITDLNIDSTKIDLSDKEQLEDMLIITLNEALAQLEQMKIDLTNESMKDMLPPGMDGLF